MTGAPAVAEPRVAVIGGGLAGLSAAIACVDGGARVTLLEARARLGGATFSFRREGLSVDNGQHVFIRCCSAYRWFLRRVGSESRTALQARMSIPVVAPGGDTAWLRRNGLPAPLHIAGSLARYRHLSVRDRLRVVRAAAALARLRPRDALDRSTLAAWLRSHGQTTAAIESLWNLIALPTLNLPADEGSLALAVKVFQTGLLEDRSAGDVGYATAPLSEIHAEPAAKAIREAGGEIRLKASVREIDARDPERFSLVVDGEPLEADAVVVATPHDVAATLLPAAALTRPERLLDLGASPIVNIHIVYDRVVMDHPFVAGVRTPVQWVFDRTGPGGVSGGRQYLAVSLSGAVREIEERTDDLRRRFLPALEALFPPARSARVETFFVTREQAATFRQAPGTASLRPGSITGTPGLFLAGAWTDTGWPATMEGAVRSGLTAARHALIRVGRTRRLPAEVAA